MGLSSFGNLCRGHKFHEDLSEEEVSSSLSTSLSLFSFSLISLLVNVVDHRLCRRRRRADRRRQARSSVFVGG